MNLAMKRIKDGRVQSERLAQAPANSAELTPEQQNSFSPMAVFNAIKSLVDVLERVP
jgi:hypothetical protein